jgi:hypothetical protein
MRLMMMMMMIGEGWGWWWWSVSDVHTLKKFVGCTRNFLEAPQYLQCWRGWTWSQLGHCWTRRMEMTGAGTATYSSFLIYWRLYTHLKLYIMDDLKEKRICWKFKDEALYGTLWRTRFGRGCGPVVRHTTKLVHAELRKRLIVSPRPSVRLCQWGSHWTDFREIYYWGLLSVCQEIPKFG